MNNSDWSRICENVQQNKFCNRVNPVKDLIYIIDKVGE